MDKLIKKQLLKLEKKESRMLNKKPNQLIEKNVNPFVERLEGKIPAGLRTTLDKAFEKAFKLVFEKGTSVIEKTYSKDRLSFEHEVNDFAIKNDKRRFSSGKYLKNMDRLSIRSRFIGKSVAFVEGAGLGLLGIGIPDIPLFISVMLKGIYEIATGYGFGYDSAQEKIYILKLIQAALTGENLKREKNIDVEAWAAKIENGSWSGSLEDEIEKTAKLLSDQMLLAKFIQGLPIIGVAGSIFNLSIYGKIADYASLKYKKRYLQQR